MRYRIEMSAELSYAILLDADSPEEAEVAAMEISPLITSAYDDGYKNNGEAWLNAEQWTLDYVTPIG